MHTLRHVMEPSRLLKASMLQDLEKQRKTEIHYINGVVSSKAKGTGIATPYNDMVVKLVQAAEEAHNVPEFKTNILAFEQLLKESRV